MKQMNDSNDTESEWPAPAERVHAIAERVHAITQARRLRDQAAKGGLSFEAYLPPSLALWLLDMIEQEMFLDPSEAAFVTLWQHEELELHTDLRDELLKRRMRSAVDEPGPGIPFEEIMADLREEFTDGRPEPARWKKRNQT